MATGGLPLESGIGCAWDAGLTRSFLAIFVVLGLGVKIDLASLNWPLWASCSSILSLPSSDGSSCQSGALSLCRRRRDTRLACLVKLLVISAYLLVLMGTGRQEASPWHPQGRGHRSGAWVPTSRPSWHPGCGISSHQQSGYSPPQGAQTHVCAVTRCLIYLDATGTALA